MKKFIFILITFIFFSCNDNLDSSYNISGRTKGITDKTKIIVEKQDSNTGQVIQIDTLIVMQGKFTYSNESQLPEMYTLRIENDPNIIAFIAEKGDINIEIDKSNKILKTKLSGTKNNNDLNYYNTNVLKFKIKQINFEKNNSMIATKAQKEKNINVLNQLKNKQIQIQNDYQSFILNFLRQKTDSFISVLLVQSMLGELEPDFEKVKYHFSKLSKINNQTTAWKKIKEKLDIVNSLSIGKKAPSFSAPNQNGKIISLKESLGEITIIDFWGSWCATCRDGNKNLVEIYNQYHNKGLNIISIGLERKNEKDKWIKAINDDKMTWTQLSNLNSWNDIISKTYNITSLPCNFILDKNGIIIDKNLKGLVLKNKIHQLLNKQE